MVVTYGISIQSDYPWGDSAGGGLAFALTMYLRDHQMPLPCGIVAMSPWTDLTASGESYESNFEKDAMFGKTKESIIYINDYSGEEEKTNPYISPAFGDFRHFPPVLIQVGSNEMLLSDALTVAEKLKEAANITHSMVRRMSFMKTSLVLLE